MASKLRTALPSLVPLPEFKYVNPTDRLWEIKAFLCFNLYIKRKCFYKNYHSFPLGKDVTLVRNQEEIGTRYRIPLRM